MKNQSYFLLLLLIVVILLLSLNLGPWKSTEQAGGEGKGPFTLSPYRPSFPTGNKCDKPSESQNSYVDKSSLYTSDIPRSLYWEGRTQDQYYSSRKNPAAFNPPCFTKKPYGNAMAMYQYWKDLPELLVQQYADCTKYECANEALNGYKALPRLERCLKIKNQKIEPSVTLACDPVNPEYYNSPEDFCRTHPEDYPCANWWMNDAKQIRDVTRDCPGEINTTRANRMTPQVPQHKNKYGFCLSSDSGCKLDDGKAILLIKRHREDHGLC